MVFLGVFFKYIYLNDCFRIILTQFLLEYHLSKKNMKKLIFVSMGKKDLSNFLQRDLSKIHISQAFKNITISHERVPLFFKKN